MANVNEKLINEVSALQAKTNIPKFGAGDTVKVHVRIREGNKERIQMFEGVVLKRQGTGIGETYTVRKITSGIGVERTFPIHSPTVAGIDVLKYGKVRQSKIFYFKKLRGKAARIKEKIVK